MCNFKLEDVRQVLDSTIFQYASSKGAHRRNFSGSGKHGRGDLGDDMQALDRGDDVFRTQATNQL